MPGGGKNGANERPIVYCVVPGALAPKLHESLRRHFIDDPSVEVVVEQRSRERRSQGERRVARPDSSREERRAIRSFDGRRVADRRAPAVAVDSRFDQRTLPRRIRPHATELLFVERLEPPTQELEDADTARLVMHIQGGDSDAFGDLYLRYFDRVYAYLSVVIADAHEAEDATQQTFIRIFQALPRYERRPAQPFRAWLFTLARNCAIDQLARLNRLDVVDPAEIGRQQEGQVAEEGELGALDWISDRDLLLLVERLPLAQRQVLVLRYMLDLPYDQIAATLNRSPEAVRHLQSRAVRFLRARLASLGRPSRDRERGRLRMRTPLVHSPVMRGRRWALRA